MMTYADLYGNIKKRPLKCGLLNKLINVGDSLASAVESMENTTLGVDSVIKAMDKFKDAGSFVDVTTLNISDRLQGI